jgi:hypothetical protein
MSNGPKPKSVWSGLLGHVIALVAAELVVLGLAWCCSPKGRQLLARLFRPRRDPRSRPPRPENPPIDV